MSSIPIYNISKSAIGGIHIHLLEVSEHDAVSPHRDDHYLLLILTRGKCEVQIDMKELTFTTPTAAILQPGQVHRLKEAYDMEGFLISAEAFLMPGHCIALFQSIPVQAYETIEDNDIMDHIKNLASLFYTSFHRRDQYAALILKGLFEALVNTFASCFYKNYEINPNGRLPRKEPQAKNLTARFKDLLFSSGDLRITPSAMAALMHVSPSHLNDCIKQETGFTVTWWLQYKVMMEAKRMLYYTNHTVKEIAYHCGFEDHTYFTRLFKKSVGISPVAFREKYRK